MSSALRVNEQKALFRVLLFHSYRTCFIYYDFKRLSQNQVKVHLRAFSLSLLGLPD